ncbi:MAG TPA: hypothetical protein VGO59_12565 [Verrucomicrobiae bacterium]|jgi:hypothetical protein
MKPTVPFELDNAFWFAETEGILSADEAGLNLEFRTSDSVIGIIKSDVRQVTLPMDSIAAVIFKKGIFESRIIIRVSQMRAAADIPGFQQGELALSISRKHRPAAEELVASIQQGMAAKKS